jgi:hypothetical protein
LEFHYTPKHASWLNMVEIEIGVLRGQCLDRRIGEAKPIRPASFTGFFALRALAGYPTCKRSATSSLCRCVSVLANTDFN